MFSVADVQTRGKIFRFETPVRRPLSRSSWLSVPASKNFSMRLSSASATISTSASRPAFTLSVMSAGTAPSVILPEPSVVNVYAFIATRSTTPVKCFSSPMGN